MGLVVGKYPDCEGEGLEIALDGALASNGSGKCSRESYQRYTLSVLLMNPATPRFPPLVRALHSSAHHIGIVQLGQERQWPSHNPLLMELPAQGLLQTYQLSRVRKITRRTGGPAMEWEQRKSPPEKKLDASSSVEDR